MASRQIATVGSHAWIANERSIVQQLEDEDVEIMAYAVRNDMEWLNEHMANIFERNIFDMAEIMKTPGRLRGKTPRTIRKSIAIHMDDREPLTDIFADNNTATTTTLVHRFQRANADSPDKQATPPPPAQPPPTLPQPQSETRTSPVRSPIKSSPPKQLSPTRIDSPTKNPIKSPIKDVVNRPSPPPVQPPLPAPSFTDSGFFTSSNPNSQADNLQDKSSKSRDSVGSQLSIDANSKRRPRLSEPNEGITSRISFTTAQEDVSVHYPPSSPVDEVALLRSGTPNQGEQEEGLRWPRELSIEQPLSTKQGNSNPQETRRSGRLALRASQSASQSSSPVPEVAVPSSPPKLTTQSVLGESVEGASAYPALPEPVPETREEQQELAAEETPQPLKQYVGDSFEADGGSKESPTPEAPLLRKSSMNFASLPAREPLTNKKKSLGAKVARESQLDQLKQNGSQRASWMNKKGNGKSLGGSSRPIIRKNGEDDEQEVEVPEPKTGDKRKSEEGSSRWRKISRGEHFVGVVVQETVKIPTKGGDDDSDAELRLHNKTSTQRLHDKISQLGKLNARNARSFPASVPQANPAYPDLSSHEQEPSSAISAKTPAQASEKQSDQTTTTTIGESVSMKSSAQPQLTRSKTDGVILASSKANQQEPVRRTSPRRPSPIKTHTQPSPLPSSVKASFERTAPVVSSPGGRSAMSPPISPLKTVSYASINDVPQFAASGASTPRKTPTTDNTLSAVKAHTSTMIQKAKEMWMKSSVASASAKAETISSPPLRKWQGAESLQDVFKRDAMSNRVPDQIKTHGRQELYPDLDSVLSNTGASKGKERETVAPAASPVVGALREGRQTRNSRSRAEEATNEASNEVAKASPAATETTTRPKTLSSGRQTRNSKSREEVGGDVASSRPSPPAPIALKAAAKKRDEDAALREMRERQQRLEEILRREKEDLERMKQRQLEDDRKPKELSTDLSEDEESIQLETDRSRLNSAEPERPPSRLQQRGGGLRFQKMEPKRITKSTKDQPSARPAPVSIKIGTASQREMQDQRHKNTIGAAGPTGSALVSALKSSFEPSLPTMNPSAAPHPPTLHTSSSNGSLRSAISSANSTKQLRSLQSAASQRKKEQEDRERKAAQKRDLERRRADNQRRQEEEQKKMQAQRQKNNTTPGPTSTKPLARAQPPASLRQTSQEPEANKKSYGSLNKTPYAHGSIKRTFPQEPEEQQSRHVPARPGTAASYHQDGSKKRRTNDYEERTYEMPPPIRSSMQKKVDTSVIPKGNGLVSMELLPLTNDKKELVSKTLTHSYVQASSSASTTSTMKASSSKVPQVESVKFSKEKIRFAGETSAPSSSTFKTPGTTKTSKKSKTPAAFKESPLYPNGESIVLPEIPTDSEDEDDYPTKKSDFTLPQWAESPELRELLRQQQTMDPTEVFGPIAKLDMETIFRTEGKQGRFRARTSSANWGGADRLTQSEILADQEARRKMMETGKWTLPGL